MPRKRVGPFAGPEASARAVALRYVLDEMPGIRRRKSGRGFSYAGPDDAPVRDKDLLKRIKSLVIPPAWTAVWICPLANGHLQATGRDTRGRKQYRYHPAWEAVRSATKYDRMIAFGHVLPKIRERLADDLALGGLPKEKVLAIVVRLLESTAIRIGNEEYARDNKSFGLTTMLNRHVDIEGASVRFRFRGKSGKAHDIDLTDRRLARLIGQCRELPGQDLFQYVDDAGETRAIDSSDVNDYIREISGDEFTAKDFRTWAGSLLAAQCLDSEEVVTDVVEAKSKLVAAVASVAAQLGNTPAVCRKGYIHPALLRAYLEPEIRELWRQAQGASQESEGMRRDEAAMLRFLERAG